MDKGVEDFMKWICTACGELKPTGAGLMLIDFQCNGQTWTKVICSHCLKEFGFQECMELLVENDTIADKVINNIAIPCYNY